MESSRDFERRQNLKVELDAHSRNPFLDVYISQQHAKGMQRTHSKMASGHSLSPINVAEDYTSSSTPRRPHSIQLPPISSLTSLLDPIRYPGDGFDYRRPALPTNDVRTPTELIDLTTSEDEADVDTTAPISRPRRAPQPSRPTTLRRTQTPRPSFPADTEIIDLDSLSDADTSPTLNNHNSDEDDIQLVYERTVPPRVPNSLQAIAHMMAAVRRANQSAAIRTHRPLRPPTAARFPARVERHMNNPSQILERGRVNPGFVLPGQLNYAHAAFFTGEPSESLPPYAPPPSRPSPEPARPGFTRSPQDGDEAVCPNCDEELCVGETDLKRQVFVIKACGHVSVHLVLCQTPR